MKPTSTYVSSSLALGLPDGRKAGLPLDSAFIMDIAGQPFQPLESLDERRGGVRVFTINKLPYPSSRNGTHALGTRLDSRLSGLFPLGSDYPGCFVGGWPKPEDGVKKDVHGLLVKWAPGRLTVWVFPDIGHDKTVLMQDWRDGNLDGVEPAK